MAGGRPRTLIGTYGDITTRPHVTRAGTRYRAYTRYRDVDGRLRPVTCTARTAALAKAELKRRLVERAGYGSGGLLSQASAFTDLTAFWLADLGHQDLAEGTKKNYREALRQVEPVFEHYTLGEITTGRVERFLREEHARSYSRAKHARTILNLLFGFALRHDAIPRNPLEGTSRLRRSAAPPKALTLEQIAKIRAAAAAWRTAPGTSGPPPDGQVRDYLEVLLGSSLRPGEALALRPCDLTDTPDGMVVHVTGTVVPKKGQGHVRQDHPKTHHSIRRILIAPFAAAVIRARLAAQPSLAAGTTIFHNKNGGPLSPHNVRRTFRDFLDDAGLQDSGITPRWYRRTGATVIARGASVQAASHYLGHGSTAITEGHYIEPNTEIDRDAAALLERTLRAHAPDDSRLKGEGPSE